MWRLAPIRLDLVVGLSTYLGPHRSEVATAQALPREGWCRPHSGPLAGGPLSHGDGRRLHWRSVEEHTNLRRDSTPAMWVGRLLGEASQTMLPVPMGGRVS